MTLTTRAPKALRRIGLAPALGTVGTVALITSTAPGAQAAPQIAPAAPALPAAPAVALLPSGDTVGISLNAPVVGATQTAAGTYLAGADGGVFTVGSAPFFGSMGGRRLNRPIVDIAATPSGRGYWMVASDGGIFNFGDAPFLGSMGNRWLNRPIVGIAPTPSGRGYWLVASDGGIFSFGDAPFLGSLGSVRLNSPIVALAAAPGGNGYWMVAADGGIFAFGGARFAGSAAGRRLAAPVAHMASTPSGNGYWLAGADGGVFSFGDAPFFGAPVNAGQGNVVAIVAVPGSYRLVTESGAVLGPGDGGARAASVSPAVIAAGVLNGINADRIATGAPPLTVDPRLSELASDWSRQMAAVGLQHRDLSGLMSDPSWSGSYNALGETLYAGDISTTAGSVMAGWQTSPSHQHTLCDGRFDVVGVGVTVAGSTVFVAADLASTA